MASSPSEATRAGPGPWARWSAAADRHPQPSSCLIHTRLGHQTPSRFGRDLRGKKPQINIIQAFKNISKDIVVKKVVILYPLEKIKLPHCAYSENNVLFNPDRVLIPTAQSRLIVCSFTKISLVTLILKGCFPPQRAEIPQQPLETAGR